MKPKQLTAILNQLPQDINITRIFIEFTCIPDDEQLRMFNKVIVHADNEMYYPFYVLAEQPENTSVLLDKSKEHDRVFAKLDEIFKEVFPNEDNK